MKDANGALVGAVVGQPSTLMLIVRDVNGVKVVFRALTNALLTSPSPFGNSDLYYQSTDCSGPPLMLAIQPPNPYIAYAYVTPQNIAYYPAGAATMLTPGSRRVYPPAPCTSPANSGSGWFAPAGTLDLSTLGLVPPFHVEGP